MKRIGNILRSKIISKKTPIDEKSLFYIFKKIIREEYGNKGVENLKPEIFKNKKIFIKAMNSNWANEVWINRANLVKKINTEIGSDEITDISV